MPRRRPARFCGGRVGRSRGPASSGSQSLPARSTLFPRRRGCLAGPTPGGEEGRPSTGFPTPPALQPRPPHERFVGPTATMIAAGRDPRVGRSERSVERLRRPARPGVTNLGGSALKHRCTYHCRGCGSHHASLKAFDAHRAGTHRDGRYCIDPAGVDGLTARQPGICDVAGPTPEVGVTVYGHESADDAAGYFRRPERERRPPTPQPDREAA